MARPRPVASRRAISTAKAVPVDQRLVHQAVPQTADRAVQDRADPAALRTMDRADRVAPETTDPVGKVDPEITDRVVPETADRVVRHRGMEMTSAATSTALRGETGPRPGARVRRRGQPGTDRCRHPVGAGTVARSTTGATRKPRTGTPSSISGALTSSESGFRCKSQ